MRRAKYPGLLPADRLAVGTEIVDMIDADARKHRAIGIHHVHRIEAAAEAHFKNQHVNSAAGEQLQCSQRAELEIGPKIRGCSHASARLQMPPMDEPSTPVCLACLSVRYSR